MRIILELARFFDVAISQLLTQKLDATISKMPFVEQSSDDALSPGPLNIDKNEIEAFTDKSIKISKILQGFKSVYAFRKSKLSDTSEEDKKNLFDIENFIQLMEHLISHNESMIRALSSDGK